ncbi:MAG: tRNA threonylcarbamoyladenosine biosynthesis protein TsaB [Acetobacteraceae bacterium]|jgi:tRNA threonylcarbamoyladenosine biosynthesis protein TsaB|nr:tRNA threonylcarbamoyladenosine biosynthesis protein TsaB [Acetobacteraceae bacterium]
MRILVLDSAVARCSATIVADGVVVAGYQRDLERGHASVLPVMAGDCLRDAGLRAAGLDLIAVTVGPGSFTGIRGGIALAQGIGVAAGRPVVGVTVGEALADSLPQLGGRTLWCATTSRRGRIFLEVGDEVFSLAVDALPRPEGPVAIAGGAALEVASRLAARGVNVMLTDARLPTGRHIAAVAERRFLGTLRPLPAEPLYIDPPEAKPRTERLAASGGLGRPPVGGAPDGGQPAGGGPEAQPVGRASDGQMDLRDLRLPDGQPPDSGA